MKLKRISLIFYLLLMLWFSLDLVGIPGLVTRDALVGPVGVLEIILLIILIGYLRGWHFSPFLSTITLGLWGYLQFASHWQYFFFGASTQQLQRYYAFYAGMARFLPESSTRLIPDAFHTILGILITINFILVLIQVIGIFAKTLSPGKV